MAKVIKVGSQVKSLKEGDWVIPRDAGLGKLKISSFGKKIKISTLFFFIYSFVFFL